MPELEDIVYSDDDEDVGAEADMNNLDAFMHVSPIPTTRIHKDHPVEQIIRDLNSAPQTRRMTKILKEHGYTQEERIDYDEVFATVARIKTIRLFLAYASFKDFVVYQMDVKSAFLYGKIEEEVYVCQPPGFEDPDFPDRVYKVEKASLSFASSSYSSDVKTANTAMETHKPLLKDADGEDVDEHMYRSMIGSLMYLTSLTPDLMFVVAYTDSDYAGASLDRKSIIGGCQFLGCRLISWQCKKQTMVANSTTEVEYVAASSCLKNPVFHSKIKHIEIRHHFIRDSNEKKLIQIIKIHTDKNVIDLLTKAFDKGIGVNAGDSKLMLLGINLLLLENVNAAKHNLLLLVFVDSHNMVAFLAKPTESDGFEQILDFLNADPIKYALTVNPTIYTSCIEQFWSTTKVKTINGEVQLQALVDGKKVIITETSKFLIHTILQCLSAKSTTWNEFSSTMASAIIFLATNQKFNFSKYIFESMVKNVDSSVKFLMYPRFVQVFLDKQVGDMSTHDEIFVTPFHTKKVFGNMKRIRKGFSGVVTPLFPTMMVQAQEEMGEGSAMPHYTPIIQPSTSQPQKKQSRRKQRKDTKIPQFSGPIEPIADEAANEENVSTQSNNLPLSRVNTLISRENRLKLKELMDLYNKLSDRVLDIEITKTTKAKEIASLKKRVKTLERKRKSKTPGMKRLFKIGRSAQVVSSKDEGLCGQEDASKQGRKIDDIDKDVEQSEKVVEEVVSTAEVSAAATITTEEITLAQVLAELRSVKPKVVVQDPLQSTTTTAPSTIPKAKSITFRDPSESTTRTTLTSIPSNIKDKGKDKMIEPEKPLKMKEHIRLDEELAFKLQAEEEEQARLAREKAEKVKEANISWDNVQAMIEADRAQRKVKKRWQESSSKRAREELEQEVAKKQKIDDDQEEAEMKKLIKVVPDEEEVAIDAIPLATKPPSIIDWKIIKEGKIKDLETLWKLVKAKHGSTRPKEGDERVLWGDLRTMLEHNIEDTVWRNLPRNKVLIWKLFDSCGVHFVRCHFSIMEGLINRLWKTSNPISEAFGIIACDKTNKPKAEDKENDEQNVAKREREFQEEGTPYSCDDCGTTSSNKNDEPVASSKA
ncbi:putative ribonuclease H-like domain-containing protein [Tanacetum coccineum]